VQSLRKRQTETVVPLQLDKFRARRHLLQTEAEKYEALQATAKPLALAPLAADRQALQSDSARVSRSMRFTQGLPKDLTLNEAVAVLKDAQ
jgi:carboxyl-terminal processing protease